MLAGMKGNNWKASKVCESGLKASKTGLNEIKVQEFAILGSTISCKSKTIYFLADEMYTQNLS